MIVAFVGVVVLFHQYCSPKTIVITMKATMMSMMRLTELMKPLLQFYLHLYSGLQLCLRVEKVVWRCVIVVDEVVMLMLMLFLHVYSDYYYHLKIHS